MTIWLMQTIVILLIVIVIVSPISRTNQRRKKEYCQLSDRNDSVLSLDLKVFKESADLVKTEILFHAAGAAQLKARSQVIVRGCGTVSRSMSDERRWEASAELFTEIIMEWKLFYENANTLQIFFQGFCNR